MHNHIPPVFVVVGPPAVGKSTTSRALAARFPQSIHLSVDDLRHMVVSGLQLPGPQWSAALEQQITLARSCITHAAFTYRSADFAVVIDDFLDPHFEQDYHALFAHPQVHKVVLYPEQRVAHQRNIQRSGANATDYIEDGIRVMYEQLQERMPRLVEAGWLVVDSTTLDVEQTVTTILQQAAVMT